MGIKSSHFIAKEKMERTGEGGNSSGMRGKLDSKEWRRNGTEEGRGGRKAKGKKSGRRGDWKLDMCPASYPAPPNSTV